MCGCSYTVATSFSSGRDSGSQLPSERDVINALTPDKRDLESSELQAEIDAGLNTYVHAHSLSLTNLQLTGLWSLAS